MSVFLEALEQKVAKLKADLADDLAEMKEEGKMADGFFDQYKDERDDGEGTLFLTAGEKQLLIDEKIGFPILSVSKGTTQYGPRWMIGIELEGESKMVGFSAGKVFSRDRQLAAIEKWLEDGGASPVVRIEMRGRSQVLVDADED